jgi:hypothetical protein
MPPSLEPILQNLTPGRDAFPEEKEAREIADRLKVLSTLLRERRARDAVGLLLATEFKGGPLTAAKETSVGRSPNLEIFRPGVATERDLATSPSGAIRDPSLFAEELNALIAGFETVTVAEFLITAIDVKPEAGPLVHTEVRFDIVGSGKEAWRGERVGR